jgi:site-specific DNA-methyltransferase (adenine-specific)/modification methylase
MMNAPVSLLDGRVQLWLGDCREILPTLDPVDAIVGDPPYGMNYGAITGGRRPIGKFSMTAWKQESRHIIGDDEPFDPAHLLGFPVVVLFGGNHFSSRLPDARCWLVWDKRAGTPPDNNADFEVAWTNLDRPGRMFSHIWRGLVRGGEENVAVSGRRVHPAQKPIALMGWVLEQCRLADGAVVVDPYMGSGSTGIAALRAGYRFVGIELDAGHFATARKRIEAEIRQPNMFVKVPPRRDEQEALAL